MSTGHKARSSKFRVVRECDFSNPSNIYHHLHGHPNRPLAFFTSKKVYIFLAIHPPFPATDVQYHMESLLRTTKNQQGRLTSGRPKLEPHLQSPICKLSPWFSLTCYSFFSAFGIETQTVSSYYGYFCNLQFCVRHSYLSPTRNDNKQFSELRPGSTKHHSADRQVVQGPSTPNSQ